MRKELLFVIVIFGLSQAQVASPLFEWISLSYNWRSEQQKDEYLKNGQYILENNAACGIKSYKGEYYISVPRWRPGVPSTLNKVIQIDGEYLLDPYPSWEMQDIRNPSALQFIQSMEIDSRGWMWMLDVGRRNFLADPSLVVNQLAKLIIWDIQNNCSVREFVFPNDILPYDNSFANDIVVDETNGFAYIPNTFANGGIIIYDFNKNDARRWNDPTLEGNPNNIVVINGIPYPVTAPADGIALSADAKTLYYCALSTTEMYSVPTNVLQDFQNPDSFISEYVQYLGYKAYSGGMAFSNNGNLYYGSMADSSVLFWNVSASPNQVINQFLVGSNETMQWADTFGFDGQGNLLFTSNKLQKFLFGGMKFDGSDGFNFRVWSVPIQGNSYLSGKPEPPSLPCRIAN